jgi:hypothetical protein
VAGTVTIRRIKRLGEEALVRERELETVRHTFSRDLEKLRETAGRAEERLRATEKRALLEIDRERSAVISASSALRVAASSACCRSSSRISTWAASNAAVRCSSAVSVRPNCLGALRFDLVAQRSQFSLRGRSSPASTGSRSLPPNARRNSRCQ